jgi:beta-glucanase (GH16 family)
MKNFLSHFPFRRWTGAGFVLALSLAGCTEKKSSPPPITPPTTTEVNAEARDYSQYTEQVWSDEFTNSAIDQSKWAYEIGGGGWGNNELEYYTNSPDNAFVSNGSLIIQANRQVQGSNNYTSARLITKGKKSFQFGRIDVRAKLPQGQGIWPAIWMLGSDIDTNNWPVCGEIDIMELRGQQPDRFLSTMHYGTGPNDHRYKGCPDQVLANGTFSDAFHVFSMVRSKDMMRFYLDGTLYYTFTSSDASPYPFNNPFFMILNVAVGGNFLGNPNASTVFPQQMQVDYVKYFQYK